MRKINKKILIRAKGIDPQDLRTVAGNRALARILGVDDHTVAGWKRAGIIPAREIEGVPYPIYDIKKVVRALEAHNEQ